MGTAFAGALQSLQSNQGGQPQSTLPQGSTLPRGPMLRAPGSAPLAPVGGITATQGKSTPGTPQLPQGMGVPGVQTQQMTRGALGAPAAQQPMRKG